MRVRCVDWTSVMGQPFTAATGGSQCELGHSRSQPFRGITAPYRTGNDPAECAPRVANLRTRVQGRERTSAVQPSEALVRTTPFLAVVAAGALVLSACSGGD